MNLPPDDLQILEELCQQYGVSAPKVLQLLKTEQEYQFKDRRTGIYPALRDVLNARYPQSKPDSES